MDKRTRVPTGVAALDRELNGGIPTGSLVAITAPPASQAELLLYTLSMGRDAYYLTAERSPVAVRDSFIRSPTDADVPEIIGVDNESPLDDITRHIKSIPEDSVAIIDNTNVLERTDGNAYRQFLNKLQTHMINTGSIAILYALDAEANPDTRNITLNMADVVFQLETYRDNNELVNLLTVPKFRGGRALDDALKLELTDTVDIDTSRDIA